MSQDTSIEWTDSTWNPVTGCSKVSQGCKNCYAERMAKRLKAMGNHRYRNGFHLTLHEDLIDIPLRWRKPRLIFVNSMSDLFHEGVPFDFVERIFETMVEADHHIFQILTKRSLRLLELSEDLPWPKNVWMGVSVENQGVKERITHLQRVPAHVRFLSLEPLLGPLDALRLEGIHWVIVGGESGPKARPIQKKWVERIQEQCDEQQVAFFFKQWGGTRKKKTGRKLNGRTYEQVPEVAFDHVSARDIFSERFASS
jgi:protein gp37